MSDFRPPGASSASHNLIPIHFSANPAKPLSGKGMWRGVPNLEHATLCAAFGLDPARFHFEVSSSMRGIGSSQRGAGTYRSTQADGRVFYLDDPEPWAKIRVCAEGQKFSDLDPASTRDWDARW